MCQVQEPRVIGQAAIVQIVVPIAETRRSAGARGTFPFGFCRKTVMGARGNSSRGELLLRELPAIIGRVEPAYARNRTTQVTREIAGVLAGNCQIFTLRDFIFPDPKAACEPYCRLQPFENVTTGFVGRAAHRESVR